MLDKVLKTIKDNNLIEYGDKIVLAISGGSDSMTLLNIMCNLSAKYNLSLYICHINHGTRNGASDDDERFVEKRAKELNLKYYVYNYNLHEESIKLKLSEEEAGRKLRYDAFYEVAKLEGATKIATAHNADDNVETIMLNIVRGTGLSGLCGIPKKSGIIIRPLISCKKSEIREYAEENNVEYVEDITNSQTVYSRNKIRNVVIPYIKENLNSNVIDNINQMSEILQDEKNFITSQVEKLYLEAAKDCYIYDSDEDINKYMIKLDLEVLSKAHIALVKRVIKKAITVINNNSSKDITNVHILNVLDIISKGTGKKCDLLNMIQCYTSYNTLVITKKNADDKNSNNNDNLSKTSIALRNNSHELIEFKKSEDKICLVDNKKNELSVCGYNINDKIAYNYNKNYANVSYRLLTKNETEDMIKKMHNDNESFISKLKSLSQKKMYFDYERLMTYTKFLQAENGDIEDITSQDKVKFRLRKRQDGDRMMISKSGQTKKIKDIFIDDKIDNDMRNKIIILEKIVPNSQDEDEIVALLGYRQNPKYQLTKDTKLILEISFDS